MSDLLPAISRSLDLQRGARVQRRAEAVVFREGVEAQVRSQIDQVKSQALGDALQVSLDEEVALLTYGRQLAGGDAVAQHLVAQKVGMQSAINNRRIMRDFGR